MNANQLSSLRFAIEARYERDLSWTRRGEKDRINRECMYIKR